MKLRQLLILTAISGLSISSQTQAQEYQLKSNNSQNKFYQKPLEPKKPKKDYDSIMKAILQKEDEILKDIEIKHRKQINKISSYK